MRPLWRGACDKATTTNRAHKVAVGTVNAMAPQERIRAICTASRRRFQNS